MKITVYAWKNVTVKQLKNLQKVIFKKKGNKNENDSKQLLTRVDVAASEVNLVE